jgi:GTP-binding protein
LIAHLVDVSDASGRPDPVQDYEVITKELASAGEGLERKPTIVVATKIDAVNEEKLTKLKRYAKRKKLEFHAISAVTGEGVDKLKWAMADLVDKTKQSAEPD